MFDNPKEELRRLEEALLAEEPECPAEEDDREPAYETEYAWEAESHPRENPAVDFARMVYADEELDEENALLKQSGKRRKDRAVKNQGRKASGGKKQKKKGIGGLVLLALLELAAIAWLIGWWLQWL